MYKDTIRSQLVLSGFSVSVRPKSYSAEPKTQDASVDGNFLLLSRDLTHFSRDGPQAADEDVQITQKLTGSVTSCLATGH